MEEWNTQFNQLLYDLGGLAFDGEVQTANALAIGLIWISTCFKQESKHDVVIVEC